MAEIALSNTSNISLATVPSGVSEPSINSIALFTIEEPTNSDAYSVHVSSDTVKELYGSDSLTYKMAQSIFAQTPNIRTGDGSLYVVPYVGTSATSTTFTTADITANINNFKNVSNGSLNLVIDGVATDITGMNFKGIQTVEDIADVINNAGFDVFVEGITTTSGDTTTNTIKFTSKRLGTESTISFGTSAHADYDISGTQYLNASTGTVVEGEDSTNEETLAEAVVRVKDTISFGGVLTTQLLDNTDILDNAETIQEYNLLYVDGTCSLKNISILGNSIKSASLTHTHAIAYSNGLVEMKQCVSAALSRALSVNWNGTNTANTLNLKQLSGIEPDLNLNQTYYTNAKTYGVDLYASTQGYSCYYSFDNGAYIDERVMDMFLKSKLEVAGFNVLATVSSKIAQTEVGMTIIKSALERILIQGTRNGYIAAGTWNSPANRFGDVEDFDDCIEQRGYYIYSTPISEQAQTEREERKAPLIQMAVKRSGAIHSVNGSVIIER